MGKYAPANEEGELPYVVLISDWGKDRSYIVYANNAANAKYKAGGRRRVGVYVTGARRATPEDLAIRSDARDE